MIASSRTRFSLLSCLVAAVIWVGASASTAHAAATIVIVNNDAAGIGFNDPTAVAPIGGNPGTTLGQQRLNAFQHAANIWGATITSVPTIRIRAQFTALACTATGAVLGSAGSILVFRDFAGAGVSGTWYNGALANKLFGATLDPATPEISANFNVNLGQPGCLTGIFFYLGLDNNHGNNVDLVTVLLHEFGHGLGFQTFTNGQTGVQQSGFPSIWDHFLLDTTSGKLWKDMTNAERAASALNTGHLVWNGSNVFANAPGVLGYGVPALKVTGPASVAGTYSVGNSVFGPVLYSPGVTGAPVLAVPNEGCTPLTNASAVAGKIAIIDRGTCAFSVKVKNAQNAGAVGVVVANNVAGSISGGMAGTDITIFIPSVLVTQADGNTLKNALLFGSRTKPAILFALTRDGSTLNGADSSSRMLMYAPNPFQGGSSVSHYDVSAYRNQLMEPAINADLTHSVIPPQDLTFKLLQDIGW